MKKILLILVFASVLFSITFSSVYAQSNPSGWAAGPFGGYNNALAISLIIIVIVVVVSLTIIYHSVRTEKHGFWIFGRQIKTKIKKK